MSLDREALNLAEQGTASFRVYGWDGLWVSLGRFQQPENAILDPAFDRWVVRPTGGKAVIHGNDITVCMAVPLMRLGAGSRSVRTAYRKLAQPLIEALRACGLAAALAEQTPHVSSGTRVADCFAFNSPNDIVHEETGEKVCGCALRIGDTAVLMQASIPIGPPIIAADALLIGGTSQNYYEWRYLEFASKLRLAEFET